ncbi:MAG: MOSC domain-containing protein [Hyphomicrobiaceae bacterium]
MAEGTSNSQIARLYRYPVKGLSPEPLDRADLQVGETFPCDRMFAIENGPGQFDEQAPKYLPKIHFLMLMRDERLASLQTHFDADTTTLTIMRGGRQVAGGNLSTPIGRKLVEQFIAAYMKDSLRGAPRIVSAEGHSFTDMRAKCVHIINLATLAEVERALGRSLDPLRFRPNIILEGVPAWGEFNWLGKTIQAGSVGLDVFHRTQRCNATNVDPSNGHRDLAVPAVLQRTWGHSDFGVYAKVSSAGSLAVGDAVITT